MGIGKLKFSLHANNIEPHRRFSGVAQDVVDEFPSEFDFEHQIQCGHEQAFLEVGVDSLHTGQLKGKLLGSFGARHYSVTDEHPYTSADGVEGEEMEMQNDRAWRRYL